MSGGFLGKGLRFPVEIDCQGGVATSEADESIRQSIQVVLGTAPGERVMRPHFGCQIHDLLYASNNIHTASLAAHFATEALTKWEPRITDVEVEADPSREEPNRLDLHVRYCVRATHSSRSLIYPFYLRRSER